MKKYNTPEMNVSMFNCETVATSETASQIVANAGIEGKNVNIYSWNEVVGAITEGTITASY